jgi:hypothetical protein
MKNVIKLGLGFSFALSVVLLASSARAQTPSQTPVPTPSHTKDQSSLGDYARKVSKDPNAPKARPKVYDNDNLPKDDKLSIVGQPAAAAEAAPPDSKSPADSKAPADAKTAPGAKPAAAPGDEKAKEAAMKEWQDKLNAQKNQIELASRELDVTQREYQLRAAAMYADTGNRMRNSAEWDKQDADYKQKIADKQKAVEDAKQKLADMQEEARKAGVPSSVSE